MSLTTIIAIGAAACGGTGENPGTGGKGGGAGGKAGSGVAGAGNKGGSAAGGSVGGAAGGKGGGVGGSAVGGSSTGGAGGFGGTPPSNPCGETIVCTVPAARCNAGAPQTCQLDALGCGFWNTTPGQPAACSANQTCEAATGTCKCNDAPGCGTPPKAGEFCTTAGGATKSVCTQGADTCFTVTTSPCAAPLTCASAVGTVVATGMACGCSAVAADQTGATVKLLGTGCTMAQATAMTRTPSKADDAILICKLDGACPTWQLSVACGAQQLTGGIDPVTSMPACVCKAPAKAGQYYVDPDPAMSNFMTGQPTGAQFPQACRLRTLTTALASTTTPAATEVIAQHEQSSNVHFLTNIGLPGVTSCDSPNSCEKFPITVPAGVHVYTADVGSFNPAHYVIDIDDVGTAKYAMLLSNGAVLEGYTLDASNTNGSGVNAGIGLVAVLTSPNVGAATATLNQVLVLTQSGAAYPPSSPVPAANTEVGVLVRGQSQWTASFLSVIGGRGSKIGILLDHATDNVASTTAKLTAAHLNVNLSGNLGGQVAVQLGTNGLTNGINVAALASADAGNVLSVTNDANDATPPVGNSARKVLVSGGSTGFAIWNGTATSTGVDVGSTATVAAPGTLTGYDVRASNSPAAMGVNIVQGNILAGSANGGVGITAVGGLVTVTSTHIAGLQTGGATPVAWTGVNVASTSPAVAGDVTLMGTMALNTVIDTAVLANSNATSVVGINVGSAADSAAATTLSRLTIADHVTVGSPTTTGGFVNGIVINNGRFVSTGTDVKVSGNWNDGIQLRGTLNPANMAMPLGQASVTGATISANRRLGVLVNDTVSASLTGVTVTGNGTAVTALGAGAVGGGIDVIRSQVSGQAGYLFKLSGSTVTANKGCGVALTGGLSMVGGVTGKRVCGVATTGEGDKVSGDIEDNTISGNTSVGLFITEANPGAGDVTEVILQSNKVLGNLTTTVDAVEPIAGGIYFAASNADGGGATPTTADIGCFGALACTRVRAEKFLGNTISCNGRHELGYGIPQRTNAASASPWDIGSAAVSVDMATACVAGALPNTITGYAGSSTTGLDLGLAVTTGLIHIQALGVHWMNAVPAAGVDYSSTLGAGTTGNGDANPPATPPVGRNGFVFCSATPAAPACGS